MDTTIIQLPFCGFYDSWYSHEIDSHLEWEAEYFANERQNEEGIAPELRLDEAEYGEILSDCLDYRKCCDLIAKAYVDAFDSVASDILGINLGLKFESLTSPKYYNFETDRVFAHIGQDVVEELYAISAADGHKTLAKVIAGRHTSRDGFHSFYECELAEWLGKPLADWDHNELHTLLLAVLTLKKEKGDEAIDWQVYYALCDGDGIYSEVWQATDWVKFDAAVAEKREEKAEAFREEHPDLPLPEPRCTLTGDLFKAAT